MTHEEGGNFKLKVLNTKFLLKLLANFSLWRDDNIFLENLALCDII